MSNPAQHPVYPIPRPVTGEDARFTIGLLLDVADVLARHGYPPISTGADLRHLQQALFGAIYQPYHPTPEETA